MTLHTEIILPLKERDIYNTWKVDIVEALKQGFKTEKADFCESAEKSHAYI